jgi:hypothetical protein
VFWFDTQPPVVDSHIVIRPPFISNDHPLLFPALITTIPFSFAAPGRTHASTVSGPVPGTAFAAM